MIYHIQNNVIIQIIVQYSVILQLRLLKVI
jgi:hypothetical protein